MNNSSYRYKAFNWKPLFIFLSRIRLHWYGAGQQGGYYPDPQDMMHLPQRTGVHSMDQYYHSGGNLGGVDQSQHVGHYYDPQEDQGLVPDCPCATRPVQVQETFLHQILMGKGYKNDCLYVNRPIKQEMYSDYTDYGCCYSNVPYHQTQYSQYSGH